MRYQYRQFKEDRLLKCPTCRTFLLFNCCKSNYDYTFKNNSNDDTITVDVAAANAARKINDNSQNNTVDGSNLVLNDNYDDVTDVAATVTVTATATATATSTTTATANATATATTTATTATTATTTANVTVTITATATATATTATTTATTTADATTTATATTNTTTTVAIDSTTIDTFVNNNEEKDENNNIDNINGTIL